ncbi:hypothetical protein BGX34_001187 [Mortierella sp. NVP85]|nr:hypothetical protein BGX34_001187 [Mortierella sp. NVP85]
MKRVYHRTYIECARMFYQDKNMDLQHQQYGKEAASDATCAADAALYQAVWEASALIHVISAMEPADYQSVLSTFFGATSTQYMVYSVLDSDREAGIALPGEETVAHRL